MNRNSLESKLYTAKVTAQNLGKKIAAGGAAMLAPVAAFAQAADPAGAIKTEIAGAKNSVGEILVALAAIIGLLLLWAYIKRAH